MIIYDEEATLSNYITVSDHVHHQMLATGTDKTKLMVKTNSSSVIDDHKDDIANHDNQDDNDNDHDEN